MKPVRTKDTNTVFKLQGGTEANDLPIYREIQPDATFINYSTWELSDEERQAIANGAKIELAVWGKGHPPVSLAVTDEGFTSDHLG